jgi:alpha-ribazole phosphatase
LCGDTCAVSTELILVRHGESNFNYEGRWQGQSQDALLSALGWQQADCAADALVSSEAVALFSSDLTRAMQTAVAISWKTGLPIYPEARLREIDAGLWTNRLSDEVLLEDPDRVRAWNEAPATLQRIPGGEGLADAQQRILSFIAERIPAYDGQSVIIAIHGAILQTLMAAADELPLERLWLATPAANGAIVRVEWSAERLRLLGSPSVTHLERLGSAGVTLGSAGGPGPGPV